MHQTLDMTWKVNRVDEQDGAVIVGSIDRIQAEMTTAGDQKFRYDSAAEGAATGIAAIGASLYDAMAAGNYEITLTARGEVRDVRLPEEVLAELKPGPGSNAAKEQAAVDVFKAMLTQGVFALPAEPPTVGQAWSTRAAVSIPGCDSAEVETTYRYEGTRDAGGTTCAVIRPTRTLNLGGSETKQITITDQKTSGEVLFDPAAGRLHSMSIDQKVALDVTVGAQTVPGTIDQKIEVMLTPKE